MDKMLALVSPHDPCFLFRHLFFQQLPDYVRIPLANAPVDDCRKLAMAADQLYLSSRQQVQAVRPFDSHAVSQPRKTPGTAPLCWYNSRYGDKAKRCDQDCPRYSSMPKSSGNESGVRR